jgi:hypothetical protein
MGKIRKWKHEGIVCKNCGKQAVVKGYCRKCYDHTPERIKKHKIQSRKDYWKNKNINAHSRKDAEKIKLYNRLNAVRKTIDSVRDCIQIKQVKKLGNSCYVSLPINWKGRDVVVFDNKFFTLHIVQRRDNAKKKA